MSFQNYELISGLSGGRLLIECTLIRKFARINPIPLLQPYFVSFG